MEQCLVLIVLLVICGTSLKAVASQRPSALSQHSWTLLPEGYDISKEFVSGEKSTLGKETGSSEAYQTSDHAHSISLREAPLWDISPHQERTRTRHQAQNPLQYYSSSTGFHGEIRIPYPTAAPHRVYYQSGSGTGAGNSSDVEDDHSDSEGAGTIHPYLFIGAAPPYHQHQLSNGFRTGSGREYGNLRPLPPDQLLKSARVNGFKPITNPVFYNDDPWQRGRGRPKPGPDFPIEDGKPTRQTGHTGLGHRPAEVGRRPSDFELRHPELGPTELGDSGLGHTYDLTSPQLELLRFRQRQRPQQSYPPYYIPKQEQKLPEEEEQQEEYGDYEDDVDGPKPNPFRVTNPGLSSRPEEAFNSHGPKNHHFVKNFPNNSPIDSFLAQVNHAVPRPTGTPSTTGNRGRYVPGQDGIYAHHVTTGSPLRGTAKYQSPQDFETKEKERPKLHFTSYPVDSGFLPPSDQNYDTEGDIPSFEDTADPFENFKSDEEALPPFQPIPSRHPPISQGVTQSGDEPSEETPAVRNVPVLVLNNITSAEGVTSAEEGSMELSMSAEEESGEEALPTPPSSPIQTIPTAEVNITTTDVMITEPPTDEVPTSLADTEEPPTENPMTETESLILTTSTESYEDEGTTTAAEVETVMPTNSTAAEDEQVTTEQSSLEETSEDTNARSQTFEAKDQDIVELTQTPFFGDLANPKTTASTSGKYGQSASRPVTKPVRPQLIYTLPPIYALHPEVTSTGATEASKTDQSSTVAIELDTEEESDMDLKALLRQVGPVSLSELLQKHNLSLGDLLKGNGAALKALRGEMPGIIRSSSGQKVETGRNLKGNATAQIIPDDGKENNRAEIEKTTLSSIASVAKDLSGSGSSDDHDHLKPEVSTQKPVTPPKTKEQTTPIRVVTTTRPARTTKAPKVDESIDASPATSSTTERVTKPPKTEPSSTTTLPTARVVRINPVTPTTQPAHKPSVPHPNWNLYNFNPYNQYPDADGIGPSTLPPKAQNPSSPELPMVVVSSSLTPVPPRRETNNIEWGQEEESAPPPAQFPPSPDVGSDQDADSAMAASAIVVSSIIGGFAIVIFLAIFVICWWRQRQRNHLRRHPVSHELHSSLIHLGIPPLPQGKGLYGRVNQPEPSLWASLRGYN